MPILWVVTKIFDNSIEECNTMCSTPRFEICNTRVMLLFCKFHQRASQKEDFLCFLTPWGRSYFEIEYQIIYTIDRDLKHLRSWKVNFRWFNQLILSCHFWQHVTDMRSLCQIRHRLKHLFSWSASDKVQHQLRIQTFIHQPVDDEMWNDFDIEKKDSHLWKNDTVETDVL